MKEEEEGGSLTGPSHFSWPADPDWDSVARWGDNC